MAEFEEKIDTSESVNYKCPECGGPLEYDPSSQSLKCSFCLKTIKLDTEKSNVEFDFSQVDNESKWDEDVHILKCENCGAENVVPIKEMSITCPFCGSNQVIETSAILGHKPNRVIPFHISKEESINRYTSFVKKKLMAPRAVKKGSFPVIVSGIYLSSWTYDSNAFSTYKGRLGKNYTRVVGSGKNRKVITETRWFSIKGTSQNEFDDILINSGTAISQNEVSRLEPFKTNESTPYNQDFLAGFQAEHYIKDVKEGFNDAKKIMESKIKASILSQYNYDVVDYLSVSTTYEKVTYKYVLLPVWIGNFKYNKKNYRFLVNGESGKTIGKFPVSPIKVTICVIIIIAIVVFFIYLASISDKSGGYYG